MLPGRILCVDDEELGLLVRKMTLEAEGYEVSIASDGPSGLELFNSQPFDLVLLDHSMPGMNGGQVVKQLRHVSALFYHQGRTRHGAGTMDYPRNRGEAWWPHRSCE